MSRTNELIDQPPDDGSSRSDIQSKQEENARGKVVDIAVDVPIPWRTSRRLQEATFRSLQERDSGLKPSTLIAKEEKEASLLVSTSSRYLRRQHSPSETVAHQNQVSDRKRVPAPPLNSGRKRRRRVHFGNPIFIHIDGQKQNPSASRAASGSSKLVSAKKSHNDHISAASQARNVSVQQQHQKQSLSCFDLLCNHVGPKGWRCYRVCLEGEAFCNNHMNRATSPATISVCT